MTAPLRRPPSMACRAARLVENEVQPGGAHVLVLETEGDWPPSRPGQFAMLRLDDARFPLLPRPFSLLGWTPRDDGGGRLEFLVMPIGIGTGLLCASRRGDRIDVTGPLGGSPFDAALPPGPIVCVAGGYGIAPFVFLAESWARAGEARLADATLVFGAREAGRLALLARARAAFPRVLPCTDDGSLGHAGRVDGRLAALLDERPPGIVLTCGPDPMMEAVGRLCRARGLPCRASMETVMGCGYAVCNGCAVAVDDALEADGYTYHLACREGTVFDEARLHWTLL